MHIVRTLVIVAILVTAVPAAAQESRPNRTRAQAAQARGLVYGQTGYYGRFLYGGAGYGYYGGYGRRFFGGTYYPYHYGEGGYGYPVWPRNGWITNDYDPEGKPLGLSASAYGDTAYNNPSWNGWPYYANGRDEAPPVPAPKAESESAVEEGRFRWYGGDMAGALAAFKRAVAEDLAKGGPRLHMALGLLATGDLRNADKALASALEIVRTPEELTELGFAEWFRNPKERAKFEDKLFPARDGAGKVTIAFAWHLLGEKEKAAKALEGVETPAAKKLGDLIR